MRRREKFIISAILLSLGLLGVQYVSLQYRFIAVFVFGILTYIVSAWALLEDLHGIEWFTIIPLPSMYALAVGMFYFLLPSNTLSRFFIIGLFGLGMYALYLTSNIFSVAKARTIQLLRAAHTIGFLFTLLISILLSNTLFSLHLPFWMNGSLLFIIHLPLLIMSFWAIDLKSKLETQVIQSSFLFSLAIAEMGIILSFLPVSVWTASLVVSSLLYVVVGMVQSHLQGRLFRNTIVEFSVFGLFVLTSFLFLVRWK